MSETITAGIVGGTGYTGGELIRLLLIHPNVKLRFATSRSKVGQKFYEIHPDLIGETEMTFAENIEPVDILFLCLPHKQSKPWMEEHNVGLQTKIIDLGNDFRLGDNPEGRNFVYGMPELYKKTIKTADSVANTGCFASGLQYALLPLAKHQLLSKVFATGITGSTGAGVKPKETTHFSWRNDNVSAYKTLTHQHIDEIKQNVENLNGSEVGLHFVPWRGDFSRGIFVSVTVECDEKLKALQHYYDDFYEDAEFVIVSKSPINLKQIVNTNKCILQLEKKDNVLVVHSAVDNLVKGAAGQAVQNMNLMFGVKETTGLKLKPSVY